ncbi:hypothetical protein BH09ACT5_BH09ACT5_01220 [soil metagenome]
MNTDDHNIWNDDRDPARQANAEERAEVERIAAELRAKAEKLEASYHRAPARSGGPVHVARPMARR